MTGLQPPAESNMGRHMALMEAISGNPPLGGNKITLLNDGPDTFTAMLEAISQAKDHINFETYIIDDDETGRLFADLFLKKQAEGVTVNVIYDGFGCRRTPASFFRRLRAGGVQALEFNPMNPLRERHTGMLPRTHRKILVIDGIVGFTGGLNIGNAYSNSPGKGGGDAPGKTLWRDSHVMIEGPGARELQQLFLTTWATQNGPELVGRTYFPAPEARGDQVVQVIGSTTGYMQRTTYMMYISAISHAVTSIHMVHSYFAPDRQMMQALMEAAARGVDVKLILPRNTDHRVIRYAGRSAYRDLLRAGVKLYERSGAILHSKTAVVDGVWSTIGTTNFELWSFTSNHEVNATVVGTRFAEEMERSFSYDLLHSVRITEEEWGTRPVFERTKEFFASLIKYWL